MKTIAELEKILKDGELGEFEETVTKYLAKLNEGSEQEVTLLQLAAALLKGSAKDDWKKEKVSFSSKPGVKYQRFFINLGEKDRASKSDIMDLIIGKVEGLTKEDFADVYTLEVFSFFEAPLDFAEAIMTNINGVDYKDREVHVELSEKKDRKPSGSRGRSFGGGDRGRSFGGDRGRSFGGDRGRSFGGGDRDRSRSFGGGDRDRSRSFDGGDRDRSRSFSGGDRDRSRSFSGGDRDRSRSFEGGDRDRSRSFGGGDRDRSRSFEGGERSRSRSFDNNERSEKARENYFNKSYESSNDSPKARFLRENKNKE